MSQMNPLHPEVERQRGAVLMDLDPHAIQSLQKEDLLDLQARLGYGGAWGVFEVPPAWVPRNKSRSSNRTVRFACESADTDHAWTEILRYALLRSLVPGKKKSIPKPITVLHEVNMAVSVAPKLLSVKGRDGAWWSRLSEERYHECVSGARGRNFVGNLKYLFRMGYLAEQPRPRVLDDGGRERNRQGETMPFNAVDERKQWQPLPDEFTGQCGQRVLWFIRELGPTILDCLDAALCVKVLGHQHESKVSKARSAVVRAWAWQHADGTPLQSLPFRLCLRRHLRPPNVGLVRGLPMSGDFQWPPTSWRELMQLVFLLQGAHAWLIFLMSGPRESTVLSHTEDCLVPVPGGHRLKGMLYKTPDQVGGRQRDWPAPPLLVQAVRQQIRLAQLVKRTGMPDDPASLGDHLWVQTSRHGVGRPGSQLYNLNSVLQRLVEVLDLEHLLDKDNPRVHSHRFRKTLARIVALALTNAQMILMDCFGHEDPDMTLSYMISDKAIVADAQRVQRELVILMATEALEDADALGGAMGDRIRQAKRQYLRVHNKRKLAPQDLYELADQLTLGGRDWVVVMPGVICTLPKFSTGVCATRQGGRNPGNCQSGCTNQLLTAYSKTETDDTVRYILKQLQRSVEDEGASTQMWAAQLRNWLYRWGEVHEKWRSHPLVQAYGDARMTPEAISA